MFLIPAQQFGIAVRQSALGHISAVGNIGCLQVACILRLAIVLFMNIALDIDRIADHEVTVADHDALRPPPIPTDGCRPFGTHPFVSVRIEVDAATEAVNATVQRRHEGANPAGHDIDNRMRDMMTLDIVATPTYGSDIIVDSLRVANFRHMDPVAVSIMEFELILGDSGVARQCRWILATLSIGLDGYMILDVPVVLVVFGELVDKSLVTAVGTKALCTDQEDVLYTTLVGPYAVVLFCLGHIK